MKIPSQWIALASATALACSLGIGVGIAVAKSQKEATMVDSAKAEFKEVVPGVKKQVLWGNHDRGPYGAFTRFEPGLVNPMHTHSSEIRIVVLQGAYLYTPQGGQEMRVGPGSFISMPGGLAHTSGGDAKEGALFYEESQGKFDLKMVKEKK